MTQQPPQRCVSPADASKDEAKDNPVTGNPKIAPQSASLAEHQLRAILDSTAASISCFRLFDDKTWEYDYFSRGVEGILGYTAEEFLADRSLWNNCVHPEDLEQIILPADEEILAGQSITLEYRFFHKDGSLRWLADTLTCQRDPTANHAIVTSVAIDITHRKQAEAELRQSETRYRSIVEDHPELVVRYRPDLTTTFVNQSYCRFFDKSPESVVGQPLFPQPSEEGVRVAHYLRQSTPANPVFGSVEQYVLPNGLTRWIHWSDRVFFDDQGNPTEIQAVGRDISGHKRAEMILQTLAEGTAFTTGADFFPALVQHLALALQVRCAIVSEKVGDRLKTLAFWSDQQFQPGLDYAYDLTPGGLTLQNGVYYCPEGVQQAFPQDHNLVLLQAESYLGVALVGADGQCLGSLCILDDKPLDSEQTCSWSPALNEPCHWFQGILQVFAARAATELERQRATMDLKQLNQELEQRVQQRTQELEHSKIVLHQNMEQFQTMFYEAPIGIALARVDDGCIVKANAIYCEMTGYSEEEMQQISFVDLTHPDDRPLDALYFQQLLEGKIPRFQMEKRYLRRDGSFIWMNLTVTLLRDETGRPIYSLRMLEDISEWKQLESERQRSETLLEQQRQMLQAIIDNAPIWIWMTDIQGKVQLINKTFVDDLKIPADRFLEANHYADVLGAKLAHQCLLSDAACLDSETPIHVTEIFPLNGRTYVMEVIKTKLKDPSGQVVGLIGLGMNITERKQAEIALRESEERLRIALDAASMGAWDWNLLTGEQVWSTQTETLYGLEPGTFSSGLSGFMSRVHPEDRPLIQQADALALKTGELQNEFRMIALDGSVRWIAARGKVFYNEDGLPVRMTGVDIDITERKQLELALQCSESKLNDVLNTAIASVTSYRLYPDTRWQYEYRSPGCQRIFGYTVEEMLQDTYLWRSRLFAGDWENIILPRMNDYFAERTTTVEYRFWHKDGSLRWISSTGVARRDTTGQYWVVTTVDTDITALKQAQTELQSQREFLRQVIDIVPSLIFVKDTEGRFLIVNQAVAETHNATVEALIGRREIDFNPQYDQERHEEFQRENWEVMRSRQSLIKHAEVIPRATGEERYYQTVIKPFIDASGQVRGVVGNAVDVTERKQAEMALARANAELARATGLKDEFLANMSHELRTPLNAILGLSEVLQEEETFGPLTDKQRQFLATIYSSGQHLLDLINDLLDVAKIEAGGLELQLTPLPIHHLCASSLSFVELQANQRNIHLSAEVVDAWGTVMVDERRMRQVLINLLSNAVKFTPAGGQVMLTAIGNAAEGTLSFSVTDTGIGIAAEDLGKLFQSFVQLDSSLDRHYEGTGLGLVLVRQLTELHGGQVSVTSEVGKGSCFTVTIPWQPDAQAARTHQNSDGGDWQRMDPEPGLEVATDSLPTHPIATPLILVAEDNPDSLAALREYLQAKGFRLLFARTGTEALELAQTQHPHLILMDVQMPEMDGLEAIHHLRSDPRTTTIPVITITALAMPGDRDRCLGRRANGYLTKPLSFKQVLRVIESHRNP